MIPDLISVIVPIYNVEDYIRQCFDSLLHQTYQNFEVLMINDGSPDNSASICQRSMQLETLVFAILKRRMVVFQQQ